MGVEIINFANKASEQRSNVNYFRDLEKDQPHPAGFLLIGHSYGSKTESLYLIEELSSDGRSFYIVCTI